MWAKAPREGIGTTCRYTQKGGTAGSDQKPLARSAVLEGRIYSQQCLDRRGGRALAACVSNEKSGADQITSYRSTARSESSE